MTNLEKNISCLHLVDHALLLPSYVFVSLNMITTNLCNVYYFGRGRGHVGRHCPYTNNIWCGSVHALLRYRSKTAKMQKFPIDSHSNENFICLFFPPAGGRQTPNYLVPVHDVCSTLSQNFTPIAPSCVEISSTVQKKQT